MSAVKPNSVSVNGVQCGTLRQPSATSVASANSATNGSSYGMNVVAAAPLIKLSELVAHAPQNETKPTTTQPSPFVPTNIEAAVAAVQAVVDETRKEKPASAAVDANVSLDRKSSEADEKATLLAVASPVKEEVKGKKLTGKWASLAEMR